MRKVELGEIAEVFGGYAFKSKDFNDTSGVPVIKISNIQGGEVSENTLKQYLPDSYLDDYENYQISRGDILVALSGATTGKTGVYNLERPSLLNQRVGLVRAKKDHADQKFLSYYVSKITDVILNKAQGVAQPNISTKELAKFEIPLPSISEQKAIVAKLDRAQRLIDIDREMLAKYDELIQSEFLEMFGDPVRNEKGLKQKEFGELVEITGGYAFKSKDFVDDESGVKVVKIANVHFIDLDWSGVQYLPIESLKEHEKYSLKEGDILLALTRPIINSLDAVKAVVVKESDLPALLNQRVARIRVDSDEVTEDYITSFIYTQHFKRQIEKYASTSLQPNVSNKEVSKIKVLVPEIDQQRKFSQMRQLILNERDALEMNQNKSEELFSSLVQGVFG